ncbi:hypothetical protein [Rhodobacter ferrooxidans]|uniref:Uncharacterized protein n=1 Tax=Rhodobacter ferrooxidans TaxID=371731 RepID=C8RX06_9RHOB|nr:hypothetical protein [Rhodobacter sp. SW2]EEW26531.1 conserved hypothetical protein [Rhodobacter sp. SW2]
MQPRDGAFSAFVDSDVLFLRPNTSAALCKPGKVSASAAASMVWAEQTIWDTIYGTFGMPIPTERIRLMRQSGKPVIPYFSAGLVVFPETPGPGGRFPDVWYDTARRLDRVETLDKRRPYLDQMTLPIAMQRAGLGWNILPEEQHYILGGRLRGEPLPKGREIYTVHYRQLAVLKEAGLHEVAQATLKSQTGVRFVRRLTPDAPEDPGTGLAQTGQIE